jgi:hypothetical protein
MNHTLMEEPSMKLFIVAFALLIATASSQNPLSSKPANPLTSPQVGVPIAFNQTYNSGTTLVSASAGFSLTVPAGNVATYTRVETGGAGLVIQDQESGFIVLGFSQADMNVLLQTDFIGLGDLQLEPIGTPQQTADTLRATFQTDIDGTPVVIHLATRQGVAGNVVVMMGFAVVGQDAGLSQALDSTLASLTLSQPDSQNSLNLGGLELYADGSSSTSNSSGDAHLTGSKEESYVFCSDGSYGYFMEDTMIFSGGDFADFSSEESDQHQGRYEVVSGIMGEPYLLLQASDGRIFLHTISQSAEGLVVNDSSFSVTQTVRCQ